MTSWYDAIIEVLEGDHGGPMHYVAIAETIIEEGIKEDVGATPAATVAAVLSQALKNNDDSIFERLGGGNYRLRPDMTESEQFDEENDDSEELEARLIKAFGILWQRDWVDWAAGRLLGKQLASRTNVNFAEQSGVYALYDRDRVIYIGRSASCDLYARLRSHTTGRFSSRWDRFSWFGLRSVRDDGELISLDEDYAEYDTELIIEGLEAVLIEVLEPAQNRRRGDQLTAVEYEQVSNTVDIKQKMLADMLRALGTSSR